jgi:DNA-binding NarL/FixJ family response regulator
MKILIVDDHPIYRKGLIALLDQMEPDTALPRANDGAQALALIAENDDLDVVILDLVIPGMDGLRAIAEFGKIRPELPVIILSSSENPADVRAALANGALGYVPKSAAEHTLLSAIRVVLNGDIYVPPFVLLQTETAHLAALKIEAGSAGRWRYLQRFRTAAQRGVVRHGEVKPERSDDRADQTFGLAERPAKHHAHRQGRADRQGGVMSLAAWRGPRLSSATFGSPHP